MQLIYKEIPSFPISKRLSSLISNDSAYRNKLVYCLTSSRVTHKARGPSPGNPTSRISAASPSHRSWQRTLVHQLESHIISCHRQSKQRGTALEKTGSSPNPCIYCSRGAVLRHHRGQRAIGNHQRCVRVIKALPRPRLALTRREISSFRGIPCRVQSALALNGRARRSESREPLN